MPKILNYIQLDGNCYFDSGYVPTVNTSIQSVFQFTATTSQSTICGVFDSGTFVYLPVYISGGGALRYCNIARTSVNNSLSSSYVTTLCTIRYNVSVNNEKRVRRNVDHQSESNDITLSNDTTAVNSNNVTLYIGCWHEQNNTGAKMKGKIYEFGIWEDGVLQKMLLPALDDNNVVCLYDYTNDSYLYNLGTGTLTYGSVDYTLDNKLDTKLKFVETYNTGFITNFYPTPKSKLKIEVDIKAGFSWGKYFGSYSANDNNSYFMENNGNSGRIDCIFRTTSSSGTTQINGLSNWQRTILEADLLNRTFYRTVNGSTTATTMSSSIVLNTNAVNSLAINGLNIGDRISGSFCHRVYSCELWDNGLLKQRYLPWRDANGKICLYEELSQTYIYPENVSDSYSIAGPSENWARATYITSTTRKHKGGERALVDDRFYSMRGSTGGTTTVINNIMTEIPTDAGTLTGLMFGSYPNTVYMEGENLDLEGIQVIGTYSGGAYIDVTSLCTCTVDTPLTINTTSATISYGGFSLSLPLTVNPNPIPAPLSTTALVHFNNNSTDEVSHTNAIVSSGGTYISAGKFSQAYSFTTSSVTFNDIFKTPSDVFEDSAGDQTITLWHKGIDIRFFGLTTSSQSWDLGISLNVNNSICTGFTYVFLDRTYNSQTGQWTQGRVTATTSGYSIPCSYSDWNHIALIFTASGITMYLNGQSIGFIDITTYVSTSTHIYEHLFNQYLVCSGSIDELLVTNNVLYSGNFQPPLGPYYI